MCEDFGIGGEAAAALAEQVELLRPNAERMSTSEDVAERLAQAIETITASGDVHLLLKALRLTVKTRSMNLKVGSAIPNASLTKTERIIIS